MSDEKKSEKETKVKGPAKDAPAGASAKAKGGGEKKSGKGKRDSSGSTSFEVQAERPRGPSKPPRMKTFYEEKVVPALMKQLGLTNRMEVPKLEKIVLNVSPKEALLNPKVMESAVNELAAITGQKPRVNRAKKSIAAFKLREGQAIGTSVTLRRAQMFEFLDRLVNVSLPRVRDFKGVNAKSFDGRGNYSMGLKEQIIFPEIDYDRVDKIRGMNITIQTSAKSNDHARALLTELGMPFRKA